MPFSEILNALIQKGLRPVADLQSLIFKEILNALIQKGLRLSLVGHNLTVQGNTECPDSKGIKTQQFVPARTVRVKY